MAHLAATSLLKEAEQTISFPPEHNSVKEIRYSKVISPCYLKPYGVIWIIFKSGELMKQFPAGKFAGLGVSWIAKTENAELEVIFYDPDVDQHKRMDLALELFKKHFGLLS